MTGEALHYRAGAETLARRCARLRAGERAYLIANPQTEAAAEYVAEACRAITPCVELQVIPPLVIHGSEPPAHVGPAMLRADVVFCLTSMSLAHTAQRRAFTDAGGRFLSLPDYSLGLLASPSLTYDFDLAIPLAGKLKGLLDNARTIRIQTEAGTNLVLSAAGRLANACPGVCDGPGVLGSPPDAEVNVAPLETLSNGVLVVDGSIPCPEIGRLSRGVRLAIRDGRIATIDEESEAAVALSRMLAAKPDNARVLAEFGIGLNPLAELSGRMLEDEGCAGTVHFGFGSNATIGGVNAVPFHLDCVILRPTVQVDGTRILDAGGLCATP
jgi:leucyl aminopeptidase (aminopeptidase T)